MKNRVHNSEEDHRLVLSGHGNNIYYRVYKGTVRWSDTSDPLSAIAVLMQHGNTEDWTEAKRNGEIKFRKTAHILIQDLTKVLDAINELKDKEK
jgi:hypothetical protein